MSMAAILPCDLQTWLRVALGFHTWAQVLVGGALGAATAGTWFIWGNAGGALAALTAWSPGLPALYGLTGAGMAAFALRNVLSWLEERREKLVLSGT